jgi:hypothetical protein
MGCGCKGTPSPKDEKNISIVKTEPTLVGDPPLTCIRGGDIMDRITSGPTWDGTTLSMTWNLVANYCYWPTMCPGEGAPTNCDCPFWFGYYFEKIVCDEGTWKYGNYGDPANPTTSCGVRKGFMCFYDYTLEQAIAQGASADILLPPAPLSHGDCWKLHWFFWYDNPCVSGKGGGNLIDSGELILGISSDGNTATYHTDCGFNPEDCPTAGNCIATIQCAINMDKTTKCVKFGPYVWFWKAVLDIWYKCCGTARDSMCSATINWEIRQVTPRGSGDDILITSGSKPIQQLCQIGDDCESKLYNLNMGAVFDPNGTTVVSGTLNPNTCYILRWWITDPTEGTKNFCDGKIFFGILGILVDGCYPVTYGPSCDNLLPPIPPPYPIDSNCVSDLSCLVLTGYATPVGQQAPITTIDFPTFPSSTVLPYNKGLSYEVSVPYQLTYTCNTAETDNSVCKECIYYSLTVNSPSGTTVNKLGPFNTTAVCPTGVAQTYNQDFYASFNLNPCDSDTVQLYYQAADPSGGACPDYDDADLTALCSPISVKTPCPKKCNLSSNTVVFSAVASQTGSSYSLAITFTYTTVCQCAGGDTDCNLPCNICIAYQIRGINVPVFSKVANVPITIPCTGTTPVSNAWVYNPDVELPAGCYLIEYWVTDGINCDSNGITNATSVYFEINPNQTPYLQINTSKCSGTTPSTTKNSFLDDKFPGGTAGSSITGSLPMFTTTGDLWTDLSGLGDGVLGFVSGGGATALTLPAGGSYSEYALTGIPQDAIYNWTFTSSSLSPGLEIQIHKDAPGYNLIGMEVDYASQTVVLYEVTSGTSYLLDTVSVTLATGTVYTFTAIVVGTILSLYLNGTPVISGFTVSTSTGTTMLIGQSAGSAGDIVITEVTVASAIISGVVTPGITSETTATATATNCSGGTGSYSYQWYISEDPNSIGTAISGATSLSLSAGSLTLNTNYFFTLKYTDTNSNVAYSNQIEMTTLPSGTYINEDFIGTTGTAVAGYEASPVNNGTDVWFDYYPTWGEMGYASGGGLTSISAVGSISLAVYPLTSAPQDGVFTFEVSSVDASALMVIQVHRDTPGSNGLVLNLNYSLGEIIVQEVVSTVTTTLSTTSYTFATGTNYVANIVMSGTSMSVFIDGVFIVNNTVTTMTGTNVFLGQFYGSMGDVTYKNVSFVKSLTAGTATAGTATVSTCSATATDATGGSPPYSYQWYRSTDGSLGYPLDTSTELNLFDPGCIYDTTYYYTLVYTDSLGNTANSNQINLTTGDFNLYMDDSFDGFAGFNLTGNTPNILANGSDVWTDLSSTGYGIFEYDTTSGVGVFASSYGTMSAAYAIYPMTSVSTDAVTQFSFNSSTTDSVAITQIGRDSGGNNFIEIDVDFVNQDINISQTISGVSNLLLNSPFELDITTNYFMAISVIGTSLSISINDQYITSNMPITTLVGTAIAIGQTVGTVGAIEFIEVSSSQV